MRLIIAIWGLFSISFLYGVDGEGVAPKRLAVLYFENNSSAHKEELAPLAKGLCDMMIGGMKGNGKVQVIERTRLEEVLKELKLTRDKAFDKKTTQQLGKLLGVQYLVFGSYFDLFGKFRIDARIVKVETGEISVAAGLTGKQDEFDILEQRVVERLLTQLLPAASTGNPDNTEQKKATINLRGAVAYGAALDKADSGDTKGAAALLRDVVESNPDFALAKQMLADFTK